MTTTSFVRKTNKEYADLLHRCLKKDQIFTSDNVDEKHIIAKCKNENYITVKSKHGSFSPLQYKCLSIYDDIQAFWKTRRVDYMSGGQIFV